MTPARDPKQEKSDFPFKFQRKLAETSIFEVLRSCRIDPYRNFLFSSNPDPFRPKNSFFHQFFEGFRRFTRVSESYQRFPKGFQGFPTVPEGFRMILIFHFFPLSWTLSDAKSDAKVTPKWPLSNSQVTPKSPQ